MEYLSKILQKIGKNTLSLLSLLGRWSLFTASMVPTLPYLILNLRLLLKQIYVTGVLSLPIIITSGFFVGMVLALQGYNVLSDYNSEESVGSMVALSLLRELGPVVTALLFTGRASSALTSEIGLMKSTEQLSALEMMAVDPVKFIYSPRFFASIITLPLLTLIFIAIGIWGASLMSISWLGVDSGSFWSQITTHVDWRDDVLNGIIKSVVFAVLIASISLFQGEEAIPTAEGVSSATTKTVVYSSLGILGLDFVLTALMFNI